MASPTLTQRLDPLGLLRSTGRAAVGAARHPDSSARALFRYGYTMSLVWPAAWLRLLDPHTFNPVEGDPRDTRFRDPAWETVPYFYMLQQYYRVSARLLDELVAAADLDPVSHQKARFVADLWKEMWSPSNGLLTNPAALRRAWETRGRSVVRGTRQMLDDVLHHGGYPSRTDREAFTLGRDLAATPGQVVFRNELIELIQYAPQTETVDPVPVLLSPAWINKFYIYDLAPGRSFVEHAVRQGRTVFAISYRNPGESDANLAFGDYLALGPLAALPVIEEITGQPQVDLVGICLGGTMAAITASFLASRGEARLRSLTLLNALVDFGTPGMLGLFTTPDSLDAAQAIMESRGYLSEGSMAHTFDLIKSRELVFSYLVSRWLLGEEGQRSDILAWSDDNTRMPARMHAEYLRACYGENALCRDAMTLGDTRLRLSEVSVPTYVLGADGDHIVPWEATLRTTELMKGRKRYVLVKAGHVGALVQPPDRGGRFRASDDAPADPQAFLAGTPERRGSWWEDWDGWCRALGGEAAPPPPMGSAAHPPLAPAPGTYVQT